jgi:aryl-alcohol dehydrogenase-like predicted oxidoreductase
VNKFQLKKKIIIGSANFTQKYGADSIKIANNEVKKILNVAIKNDICAIDTAEAYLKNKNTFKKINKKFKFTSKIILNYKWKSLEYCQKKLEDHFKNLNLKKIDTLLIHNEKILLTKNGLKIFKNLEVLKKEKYFHKIGLSIYDTHNLKYIISKFNLNVVQCPYNILDQRIFNTGWFDRLKYKGIEIHARSIFLQGLLVNKLVYRKQYFKRWHKNISNWFKWLENNNISPIDYCLSDLLSRDFDKIIIGINNLDNLKEIINFRKIDIKKKLNFRLNDLKLIDPRKWKKK